MDQAGILFDPQLLALELEGNRTLSSYNMQNAVILQYLVFLRLGSIEPGPFIGGPKYKSQNPFAAELGVRHLRRREQVQVQERVVADDHRGGRRGAAREEGAGAARAARDAGAGS